MYPYHPSVNSLGALDGQFHTVSGKFPCQIPSSRASVQDFSNHELLGNQFPWKGPVQGQYGHQAGDLGRSQLQQQQSLQYQQQQPSFEQSRHHQAQWEPEIQFPETSYSALLHGPDTPPFQSESSWDASIAESGSHAAGGSTDASFQGFTSDYSYNSNMQNYQNTEPQPEFYTEPSMYVSGGQGIGLHLSASHSVEHSNTNLSLPLKINGGPAILPMLPQNPQYTSQSFAPKLHNSMDLLTAHSENHPASNNEHQSHEIALRQENSWGQFDQNQGFQNVERTSIQMHQYRMSTDPGNMASRLGHYQQSGSILPEYGFSKQQQGWNMASNGIPVDEITKESEHQQYNAWNAAQIQKMHTDIITHLQQPGDGKYNAWGTEALQNGRCTESDVLAGWPMHSSDSATIMATNNFQPFQDSVYQSAFRQDSGILPPVEAYDQYPGNRKNFSSQKQFQGVQSSYSSFNEGKNLENWAPEHQQRTNEATSIKAGQMKPGLTTQQDPTRSQQHNNYMALSPSVNMQYSQIQTKPTQVPFSNQNVSNFMKTSSVKSLPTADTNRGIPMNEKDDEFEGPKFKRQREVSQLGNAHLVSSNSSISSRPPNMMSGLAPAGMAKNFLHTNSVGQIKYSGPLELDKSLRPNIQKSAGHAIEMEIDHRNNSPAKVQWDVQRPMILPNPSPLISQGSIMYEVPTQLGHGKIINKDTKNVALDHSSVEQSQGLDMHPQGKTKSGPALAGNEPRKMSYEIHNMKIIQSDINSNQPKLGNVPDMLTAWKNSFSEHPVQMEERAKSFPEGMDSVHPAFRGGQQDVTNAMQETHINMKKSSSGDELSNMRKSNLGNFYNEDSNFFPKQNIGNQSFEDKCSMPVKLPHEPTFNVDSTPHTQMELQKQRISTPLTSPLNGLKRGLLLNERQDRNQLMFSKPVPQQACVSQGRSGKPLVEVPFPVQNQRQQLQAENENRPMQHTGTWVPRVLDSARQGLDETYVKPLDDQFNSVASGKRDNMHHSANDVMIVRHEKNNYLSEIEGQITPPQAAGPFLKIDSVKSSHSASNNFDFRGPGSLYSRFEQLTPSQSSAYRNSKDLHEDAKCSSVQIGQHIFQSRSTQEHQSSLSKPAPVMIHPKKRKNSVPHLFPWHVAATQHRGQLIPMSKTELIWANTTNRLPEKNFDEVHNHNISRAKMRLRSTTQLMQQLFPPDSTILNSRISHINNEFIVYNLAKVALAEACRLMVNTEKEADPDQKGADGKAMVIHGQGRTVCITKELALTRITERFNEKIKLLEKEVSRIDTSVSGVDLKENTYDLEKLFIVNRLSKSYGTEFLDSSENILVEKYQHHNPGIRRPPQRYVIPVPMLRTLPEDVRCLSL